MDERIQRFKQMVENQGGRGRDGYPEEARQLAAEYGSDRLATGEKIATAASALGVAPQTLLKWIGRLVPAVSSAAKAKPERLIVVKETLHNPHPLVADTKQRFRNPWVDPQKRHAPGRRGVLNIKVCPDSIPRALRLMDALVKALVERGHVVAISGPDNKDTVVRFGPEEIEFGLIEQVEGFSRAPTPQEREWSSFRGRDDRTVRDYRPTGRLQFRIMKWSDVGLPKSWTDGKRGRLEDMLDDIVAALEKWGAYELRRREEHEEHARQREVARRQREDEQQRAASLQQRVEHLIDEAERWHKADRVRAYITAVRGNAERSGWSPGTSPDFEEWLAWAEACAEKLDPLSRAGCRLSTEC